MQIKAYVYYDNKDISTSIGKYLKSISYTDNMSGAADDLQLTLEDRAGLWQSAWFPEKGAKLRVKLENEKLEVLDFGEFELDEITSSSAPSEIQLKAISIPYSNSLREEERTRSWEKAELKTVANDIAIASNLKLFYDTEENPLLERVEQTEQSDLSFLLQLCSDRGLALKISDGKLIIFDEATYEQAEVVLSIAKPVLGKNSMLIKGYSLTSKLRDIYASCHVKYQEGKGKRLIEATFTAEGKTGKILQVREQVESIAEADRLAKKRLREKNKDEFTGSFTLVGNFKLVAGIVVALVGFGAFDGRYIITKASHDVGGGYITTVDVRRCLNGY